MVCKCGGTTRGSTWKTVDGWIHFADTCTACGRYHRWPSIHEVTREVRDMKQQLELTNATNDVENDGTESGCQR